MRRLVNALGMLLPALFLLLAGYSGCSVPLVLSCFVCGAGFGALAWLGCLTSFFDFAPRFAPVIFGISNTFGQSAGFLAPHTTGLLLRGGNSHRNWLWAFWVSAMVYIPGGENKFSFCCCAIFFFRFPMGNLILFVEKYTLLSHKKYLIPHNNSNSSPPLIRFPVLPIFEH